MIVSFHPLFEADKNIICAGREPNGEDLAAIRAADAVILSQGCCRELYDMARENCPHVFPNYNARFKYPGKINQIKSRKAAHNDGWIFLVLQKTSQLIQVFNFFQPLGGVYQ